MIHDLALLRLRGAQGAAPIEFTPLPFRSASAPLAKGERLYSLGNPLDVGFAVAEGVYNGRWNAASCRRSFSVAR